MTFVHAAGDITRKFLSKINKMRSDFNILFIIFIYTVYCAMSIDPILQLHSLQSSKQVKLYKMSLFLKGVCHEIFDLQFFS